MNDTHIKTLEQVRQSLAGTQAMELVIEGRAECYAWNDQTLIRFGYRRLSKVEKSLLLGFIEKVSGYSRIQVKRLVAQYLGTGRLKRRQRAAPRQARGQSR